ncbi:MULTISPECIES: Uma2 family endonuclease [Sorangium]|uniref:Uma2 family endonuclease n=1 Tax=Sorangium TaxID=39643 RepID=UPI0003046A0C|nr:Uma2 family endonuclease [Sorangium cellulosum]
MIRQSALTGTAVERRITFAEWTSLPEEEPGELVDGRLVEEEAPDAVHEVIVAWVIRVLGGWLIPQGGLVLGSEAKYAVSAVSGRKPDASAYMPQSRKPPRRGTIHAPPDIMVEVVSPTPRDARRDRVEKLHEYASFGVRWYWIIDPQERTIELLELGTDRRYVHARSAADGIVGNLPGVEGLSLELDALWSEVELLGPESGEGALGDPEAQSRCRTSCGTCLNLEPTLSAPPSS